jgi:predicted methyltransferase
MTGRETFRLALAALLLLPALAFAQASKQDINAPYVTNPDVLYWTSALENDAREVYARRNQIVAATGAKPGMAVADVGAGSGLFTRLFAKAVQPGGRVYAVDISQEFLDHILESSKKQGLDNVVAVLDSGSDSKLPENALDLVFICDTYHHFEDAAAVLASIRRALKPGGRLVVIDYELIPGVTPQQRIDHVRIDRKTAIGQIETAGFNLVGEKNILRENWFATFSRP